MNEMGAAASEYVAAGWVLVPLAKGRKTPTAPHWNRADNCVSSREQAANLDWANVGVALAYSRLATLDVDDYVGAEAYLREHGFDLDKSLCADDAVQIQSGRPNRAKLLFRLPDNIAPPPTATVHGAQEQMVFELRCATKGGLTVQDVLPPSIHPDTNDPYQWGGAGTWRRPPELPPSLLAVWRSQLAPGDSRQQARGPASTGSIAAGARNDTLFRLGASLRAKGLGESALRAALREENAARCAPPLEESEVDLIAASAGKYEQGAVAVGGGTVTPIGPALAAKAAKQQATNEDAWGRAGAETKRYVFVKDQNQWFDKKTGFFFCKDAVNSAHQSEFNTPKLSTAILTSPTAQVVDTATWVPEAAEIVETDGRICINTWRNDGVRGKVGNVRPWVEHVEWLIPNKREREHLLDWLAFTLQFPARKINHQIVLGGSQRIGKDTLIQPMVRALGSSVSEPQAHELQEGFNDYIDGVKLIVVQEIHSFRRQDIENKLKPICAAPPNTLRVNNKGLRKYTIPNLVSVVFMTNYRADAMSISQDDGRYFCVWSPVVPKQTAYYADLYAWMNRGGDRAVIQYLHERDVSGFLPGASPPDTEWKRVLQGASVPRLEFILSEMIEEESPPFDRNIIQWREIVKARPELAKHEGILHVALANLGAVKRRCDFRSVDEGKKVTRNLWIVRGHDKYLPMPDAVLGREWEKGRTMD